jgi:hypothetical protein
MTWREIERRWHDTGVQNCTLCGRLIPRRVWIVEIDGAEFAFCSVDCEGLYRSYWLPRYKDAGPAGSAHEGSPAGVGPMEEKR